MSPGTPNRGQSADRERLTVGDPIVIRALLRGLLVGLARQVGAPDKSIRQSIRDEVNMRSLLLLSAIAAISGCSDNQQPTTPARTRPGRCRAEPRTTRRTQNPNPAPSRSRRSRLLRLNRDDRRFIRRRSLGPVPRGPRYRLEAATRYTTNGGTVPFLHNSLPTGPLDTPTGWTASVDNTQAGSAPVSLQAWVLCAS